MFQTKIQMFQSVHAQQISMFRATSSYSLPKSIAKVIDVIGDLQYLPSIPPTKISPLGRGSWPNGCDGLFGCQGLVTPQVLKQRYSLNSVKLDSQKNYSPKLVKLEKSIERKLFSSARNSMAVAEFQGQYFDTKDLEKFSAGCHVNVTVDHVIGGDVQVAGIESLLDIEYIKALAPEIPLTFVYSAQYSLLK